MGTRSITVVRSKWTDETKYKTHATIFLHLGGQLSVHGKFMFEFLDGLEVFNGKSERLKVKHVNGPGRLAANLVVDLVDYGHDPSLYPEDTQTDFEIFYQVSVDFGINGGKVYVAVLSGSSDIKDPMTELFSGCVKAYGEYLKYAGVDDG